VLRDVIGHIRGGRYRLHGDSHYARMAWCERKRIGKSFGLASNPVLLRRVGDLAENAPAGDGEADKVRRYGKIPPTPAQAGKCNGPCPPGNPGGRLLSMADLARR
jgi:hypothetical protein